MENHNWRGLMKVLEVWCEASDGELLWRRENLRNTLHNGGEQFILLALFTGGQANTIIPVNFYLGLDNRPVVSASDEMPSLTNEPTGNGYTRQPLSSTGGFTVEFTSGSHRANTGIATFRSSGLSWGPVSNLFLATSPDASGYLIATAPLGSSFTVPAGNTVSLRLGLSLRDC